MHPCGPEAEPACAEDWGSDPSVLRGARGGIQGSPGRAQRAHAAMSESGLDRCVSAFRPKYCNLFVLVGKRGTISCDKTQYC